MKYQRLKLSIVLFVLFCLSAGFMVFNIVSAQEGFIYDAKAQRNPFIPLVTQDGRLLQLEKSERKERILIEGIIFDKYGLSYAIINGAVVKVGDFVDEIQVLKIEKTKVIFIKEGQVSEIELKEEK